MSSTRSVVTVSVRPLFRQWTKPVVVVIRTCNGMVDGGGIDRPTAFPDAMTPRAGG
jgi:hypothetical protein